ncbi:MAG: amidohydrolase family protein [Planctomycetes bacterium]|nr:amidohydrolase family protein [Planctomycetota bacterium]
MTPHSWLCSDALLVPMDGPPEQPLGFVRRGSLRITGDRIAALGELAPLPGESVVSMHGALLLPGFVQGHVHATQTLFRGLADDLPLLPWLQQRIWPLEHAHDAESTRTSADLTMAELLAGGTTTVQTMESVRHAEQTCDSALAHGLVAIVANCLMDQSGPGVPEGLPSSARENLATTEALWRTYHGRDGRLCTAVAPRFLLSVSADLAHAAVAFAAASGLRIHSHAGEHPDEVALVRQQFGRDYLEVLHDQGWLGPRTSLAHCVHTTARERHLLAATDTAVLHCPSTNCKLGSGIAPIVDYLQRGVRVALGADGAPCNNRLSQLAELRQMALLQALASGPGALPAARALWLATRGGAAALGLDHLVGSLRPGLRADCAVFDLGDPRLGGADGAAGVPSQLVYAADERHLRHVLVGGRFAVRDGQPVGFDWRELRARAAAVLPAVLQRAGLAR